ncbi:MAG TPA: sigma-70 family RNA polymerase sigma factor [Terriglobia bacterium]|nr:sigma-70 family RNA polymerase sigma factor [Terriglobia bacterium]
MASSGQEGQEVEWIKSAQGGDRESFGLLVQQHQRRVFSLVFNLVRRPTDVEDLVQEIFIKAYRAIRSYNFKASFAAWISRIAVNHCYDYLRRERSSKVSYYWQISEDAQRAIEANAGVKGQESLEEQTAARELAGRLLERAPAKDRVVLTLREIEGRSIEEIAGILKLNPSTVKVRLHRARKRMLEDLQRWRKRSGHAM